MPGASGATAGDHRNVHGRGNRANQLTVKAGARAFLVDGGEQDLAGPHLRGAHRPLRRVRMRVLATVVDERLAHSLWLPPRFHRHDNGGCPEAAAGLGDELRSAQGRRVDGHLVGAGPQHGLDVIQGTQPACHGKRDRNVVCGAAHDVQQAVASVEGCHNVHVEQLIRSGLIVVPRERLGLSQNAQALQVYALHQVGSLDVGPGDDAGSVHGCASGRRPVAKQRFCQAPVHHGINVNRSLPRHHVRKRLRAQKVVVGKKVVHL